MLDGQCNQALDGTEEVQRGPGRQAVAVYRSFVPLYPFRYGTLLDRALRWLLPWELREYPGLNRGASEALPEITSQTIFAVRRGRRRLMPHIAAHLADMIEADCKRGLALVEELRRVEAEPSRMVKGFREVKDWGDGKVTDKRRRAKRV